MSFSNHVAAGGQAFQMDVCKGFVSSNPTHLPFRRAFAQWLHRDIDEGRKGPEIKYFYYDDFCRLNITDGSILIMWRPLHALISEGIAQHYGWEPAVLGIAPTPEVTMLRLRVAAERAEILRAFTDVGGTTRPSTCPEHDYVDIQKSKLWAAFSINDGSEFFYRFVQKNL